MAIERYTMEQLGLLELVAWAPDPLAYAEQVRKNWRYIKHLADEALEGRIVDPTLPQITKNAKGSLKRAESLLAVLDEWINERIHKRSGST